MKNSKFIKLTSALLTGVLLLGLTACGGGSSSSETTGATSGETGTVSEETQAAQEGEKVVTAAISTGWQLCCMLFCFKFPKQNKGINTCDSNDGKYDSADGRQITKKIAD